MPSGPNVRESQLGRESLVKGTPNVRESQLGRESLVQGTPNVRAAQIGRESLILIGTTSPALMNVRTAHQRRQKQHHKFHTQFKLINPGNRNQFVMSFVVT